MTPMLKVTAFVTRGEGAQRELLVLQHPSAGVQLPAGTVEVGEGVEAAALREVSEETGLSAVRLLGRLGSERLALDDEARILARSTELLRGPRCDAGALGHLPRALWCRVNARVGDFAEVVHEEFDWNVQPRRLLTRYSGWVLGDVLCDEVERHFFHFEPCEPTAERWVQQCEVRFECHWVRLHPRPSLQEQQQPWLDRHHAALAG